MQLEEKKERIFKESPFLYHHDMELVLENKKTDTNNDEMTRFLSKKLIGTLDLVILDTLYLFDALNRYCLEEYLNFTLQDKTNNNLKQNLHKLMEQGVILRYTYTFKDHEKKEHRTPYIYTLSRGAFSYIKRFRKKAEKEKKYNLFESEAGLYKLALNQFYIQFLKNYSPFVQHIIYDSIVDIGNNNFNIDLCFRVNTKLVSKQYIDLAIIPIRRNKSWELSTKNKIDNILKYANKSRQNKISLDVPIFILLAEDDVHIKQAFSYLENISDYDNHMFLFTSDLQTVREPILDYLYECYTEKKNTIKSHTNGFDEHSPIRQSNTKEITTLNDNCISMVRRKLLL